MRVATWNVDSIRARESVVLDWLERRAPDVIAFQETKCADRMFPRRGFESLGYELAVHGDGGQRGVALASRVGLADVELGFPGATPAPFDEARVVSATCGGVRTYGAYAPNGRKVGTSHHQVKLAWFQLLGAVLALEEPVDHDVLVLGDLNIAPSDLDVHDPAKYRGRNLTSQVERDAFAALLDLGFHDLIRDHLGDERRYTWWNRSRNMFPDGRGWRLDAVLASPGLAETSTDLVIDIDERAKPGCSDHAPVLVSFPSAHGHRT